MSKSSKSKKNKVPKLTEAEYAEYISSLRGTAEPNETPRGEKEGVQSSASREE